MDLIVWLMNTSLCPSYKTPFINNKDLIKNSESEPFFHNNLKKIKKATFYTHLNRGFELLLLHVHVKRIPKDGTIPAGSFYRNQPSKSDESKGRSEIQDRNIIVSENIDANRLRHRTVVRK